ncbi:M20/M25/M40 family metallo-hydrolase [Neobacillus sp. Marseille-QA0830]
MHQKTILSIAAAGLILSAGAIYVHSSTNQPEKQQRTTALQTPNADNMYKTIEYLSTQPRAAGTDGERKAVKYIEKQFKSLGYDTEVQSFPIYNYKTNHLSVKINGTALKETPEPFTGDASGKVQAPLIYAGKAKKSNINEEVKGKIALVERGDIPFVEKVQNLIKGGAIGVIMFNNSPDGVVAGQLPDNTTFPAVAISREAGLKLVEQLKTASVTADMDIDITKVESKSYNVIASRKPDKRDDTGQIVTIGAHHDSVPEAPGANDDASGVSAVLELAQIFAKTPIDTELRFLTFGSEERGLIGSTYYVNHLPKKEISQITAHFQMDMIGSKNAGGKHTAGGLIMYTLDGKKNLVTDLSAAAAKQVLSEVIPYGKSGRSDHEPFHQLGIPAALFMHAPAEPDYHKPTDTIDKISKEKLKQTAEIIEDAVYEIADPDTPAFTKGNSMQAAVDYPFEIREVD